MELEYLVGIFAVATVFLWICRQLKIPSVIGLLSAGALAGPFGLQLVQSSDSLSSIAEIGAAMLLFSVGLEIHVDRLVRAWRSILVIALVQIGVTALMIALLMGLLEATLVESSLIGCIVAMSSTALVARVLDERKEITTDSGNVALGVLLIQDFAIVPLSIAVAALGSAHAGAAWFQPLALGVGVTVALLIAAFTVVPKFLAAVSTTRNRELFVFSLAVVCLGMGTITHWAGLSFVLGAFLAGLAVSKSDTASQALADAVPLRHIFGALFFLTLGMLLNPKVLLQEYSQVILVVVAILVTKALVAALATRFARYPWSVAVAVGLALSQVGEFSFVLMNEAFAHNLITESRYQVLVAAAVFSMLFTPLLMSQGNRIAHWFGTEWGENKRDSAGDLENHVVICGFGPVGQSAAEAIRKAERAHVIVDTNPQTIRKLRSERRRAVLGDCSNQAILTNDNVAVERASLIIIAISGRSTMFNAVRNIRLITKDVPIVCRCDFASDRDLLKYLGANHVISSEEMAQQEMSTVVTGLCPAPQPPVTSGDAEAAKAPTS